LSRAVGGRLIRALFLAPALLVPVAVRLRKSRRRWRGNGRRLLRLSRRETAVVLARVSERLGLPVPARTRRRCDGSRLQRPAVTVGVTAGRALLRPRIAERSERRDWRRRSGGRSRLHGNRSRPGTPHGPGVGALVCPMRPGAGLLPSGHQLRGTSDRRPRGTSRAPDRLRGVMHDWSREIRGHPPGGAADDSQQRRRLAGDAGSRKQEEGERDPHRGGEGEGHCRGELGERRFHVPLIGSWRPFAERERNFTKHTAKPAVSPTFLPKPDALALAPVGD
jgi:hypothetical protein